ncbi:lipopolysaccharide biosynthesis protein, partial [Proteus mirabilis]|nr:oligosaccharide flippase family protein [Proteus mirabilis]EKV2710940.1 oligosaccharide flippase family protein [Proteus mirabilis]
MLKKLVGMSGALALAQIVNFIAISYGSKLFGAEEFGKYSYVNSLSLAISVLFYLKADSVILLEAKEDISKTFYHINRYSTLLLFLLLFFIAFTSLVYHDKELIFLTLAGVILAYFNAKFILFGSALIKEDKTSKYGITAVIRPFLMLIGQYIINYIPKVIYPMVIVRILSEIIASIFRRRKEKTDNYEKTKVKSFVLRKKEYFIYGTVASLLNSISQQVPMVILPLKYGYESLAYFSLAFSLTLAPMTLIFSPLRNLLLKKISTINEQKNFVIKYSFILSVPTIIIIIAFNISSDFFIDLVWGKEWEDTAYYMKLIIFWVGSGLVSS